MSQEIRCPKCSGIMREGELFIDVINTPSSVIPYPGGFSPMFEPTSSISSVATGEGPFWRERTGQKKGLLVKRNEMQTLNIAGLRCTNCGYIELYANKSKSS